MGSPLGPLVLLCLLVVGALAVNIPFQHFDFDAVSLSGKVYFPGGLDNTNTATRRVEIYNGATGLFEAPLLLSTGRTRGGLAASDNAVFFAGGVFGNDAECLPSNITNVVDVIFANGSQTTTTMSQARCDVAGARVGTSPIW